MELKMEVGLDQLIQAIKQLPARQLAKLKAEIEEARKSMNKWGKN